MTNRWLRSGLAGVLAVLLGAPPYALRATEGRPSSVSSAKGGLAIPDTGLSEEQKILHALNRLGFGPRPGMAGKPGDLERVKQMGLAAYIEQQLQPETIPDRDVEDRLAGFKTLTMSSTQLLATYPPPQLLRGIERRLSAQMGMDPEAEGTLFPELARRRDPSASPPRRAASGQGGPETREPRPAGERMTPQERMQEAMAGPGRIVIELSQAKLLRAIYSERQLQEVMTDFWFNHFNVFVGKGADRWLTTSYEQQAIRPHALGKFRDLLGATAQHPAMLFYLDNWLSADPNADYDERELRGRYAAHLREQGLQPGALLVELFRQRGMDTAQIERLVGRQLDRMEEGDNRRRPLRGRFGQNRQRRPQQQQQRRRGLNENYARELLELHTLGVDGRYTQKDIIEVARCFTGWTLLPLQMGQQFLYMDEFHDQGAKVVLGQKIENGGRRDGDRVLDLVARHPSTARFISTKLARRFVSDTPPAPLVDRMAATFRETDGDIRAVLRTLVNAPEFWSAEAVGAKVKTPLEFVASAARATNAKVDDLPPGLVVALRGLGQPLYGAQPPTGYKDTADAWVSTGALLGRMKVALGLAANRVPGVRVDLPQSLGRSGSSDELVAQLGQQLLGRPVSDQTRAALEAELAKAKNEIAAGSAPAQLARDEVEGRLALGWILASPEFQRK